MSPIEFSDLPSFVGKEVGVSDWLQITQERVNQFADATGDHQWIHVDVERATREIGGPIAHGFLTLSLVSDLLFGLTTVEGSPMVINYGLDKVRFLGVVPVNSRVRAKSQITAVTRAAQGVRVNSTVTIELEGSAKPALVAESIALFILDTA